jgi:hypothetical protein
MIISFDWNSRNEIKPQPIEKTCLENNDRKEYVKEYYKQYYINNKDILNNNNKQRYSQKKEYAKLYYHRNKKQKAEYYNANKEKFRNTINNIIKLIRKK